MEKFDASKMFDAEATLTQVEKYAKLAIGYVPVESVRGALETVATAQFEFARAQAQATKAYADSMRKVFQI